MAKVLVVTSGKGGVGKTTSTAALGAALAQSGQNVVVVDFDVGLRNLDLVMGAERRVVFDLINVVQGVAKLPQALIRDKRLENLWLLPASQTRDKDALTDEGVGRVIGELRSRFDWILCDSPAGIERGATLAMRYADEAVIVTNPEVSSVRDSDRIIGMLDSKTVKAEKGERVDKHVLITRYDPQSVKRRHPGDAQQFRERAGARLYRRLAPPDGRGSRHGGAGRTQGLHGPATRQGDGQAGARQERLDAGSRHRGAQQFRQVEGAGREAYGRLGIFRVPDAAPHVAPRPRRDRSTV